MRILHVIPAVAARYGGPSTAIWPMASALRQLGNIDVEIATTDADGPGSSLTAADLPRDAGVVHLFRRNRGEGFKYSSALCTWLNSHSCEFDVVQTHSNWNHPVAAACQAARRAGVPYIIRPCGMLSSYTWLKSKWKKRIYWWLRERTNVRQAAGFHVTSEDECQEVLRLGVKVPIEVIPLGIGNDAWDATIERGWLREQCPQAGKRPILLFLSRIHPKKGITDFLLPAVAQLKTDAFLAIVGGEDDHAPGFARQVANEICRLGLSNRVALLGPVPPSRRWSAFDGADLFVLPSHSENFGIVVAEAMARCKPVVVTTGVQFGKHVSSCQAGTVVPLDISALTVALDLWLSNPSQCARAGEAGSQYIRHHFTWRQTAESLAALYRRVCNKVQQAVEIEL
jgi:glycosyltransferase involved in cell wall biosynthesis